MNDDTRLNNKELHRSFLIAGKRFFEYNGSKNTPNILEQLNSQIESLKDATQQTREAVSNLSTCVKEANASSSKLATVLNRLTLLYSIVTGVGVGIATWALIYQIWFSK